MSVCAIRCLTAGLTILACLAGQGPARAEGPAYVVKDVTSGSEPWVSSKPHGLVDLGGVVVFTARDDTHGVELWRSNGQADGTSLVADIAPGTENGVRVGPSASRDGVLYFPGPGGVWRSDGTAEGTRLLAALDAYDMVAGRDTLYVFTNQYGLWRVAYADGAATQIGDFPNSQIVPSLTLVGDRLFFAVSGADEELWTSDGTAVGTRLVRRVQLTNREGGNEQSQLFAVGAQLFFVGRDESGWEVWRSDGTTAGTRRVRDINPAGSSLHFNDYSEMPQPFFAALGDTLLFMANDGVTGLELWRSDGTEAGTQRLTDAAAGPLGLDGTLGGDDESDVAQNTIVMLAAAGRLFFSARPSGLALELWETDGTAAGTRQVTPLSADWATVQGATVADALLYFSTQSNEGGTKLWTSDGTAAGTTAITAPFWYATELTPAFGGILFAAEDAATGRELWFSDGTADGTQLVRDIEPDGGEPTQLVGDHHGGVFFFAPQPATGYELWHSDGTFDGTHLVRDIRPGPDSSFPFSWPPLLFGETLLFSAIDTEHGAELWRSDGSTAGTSLVADIQPGDGWADPAGFTPVNDVVLFFAGTPSGQGELWRTDGTGDGTVRLADTGWSFGAPATDGKRALLSTRTSYGTATRSRLWRSDGTAAGTYVVGDLRFSNASVAATADGLFAMLDGAELYRLDCGTLMESSDPLADLTGLGDRLLFTGPLAVGAGTRIWTSDGTADGTAPVQDLLASPDDGQPRPIVPPQFTRAGDLVFFVGDFEGRGSELWALPVSALPPVTASTCPPPPTPRSTPGPFDCPDGSERCTVLEIGAVAADVGETVTITATLHSTDGPIAGIQNDLAFSDGVTVAARGDGRPDCDAVPEVGKDGTSFAFQPSGCTPGTDCTGLRAIVLSFSNVDPIPDGAALYTCTVRVAPDAAPGHHRLELSNLGAADPDGFAVPLARIDGAVEVRDREGSHPQSRASADSGCQTVPSSSPAGALPLLALALLWLRRRAA